MAVTHHLIADAWTFGLIINQVMDIYASLINNSPININWSSYVDYINSEKEYLQSEKFKRDEAYWLDKFSTVPEVATLPSPKSKQAIRNNSLRKTYCFPLDVSSKIKQFCINNKISVFNFFVGIYSVYIAKACNLKDFVLGTPILNRGTFKEKNATGMFINMAPFRVSINSDYGFIDFLSDIAKDTMTLLRHQKYPYQVLLETLRKTNSDLPNLFDISLSYQNMRNNKQSSSIDFDTYWIPTSHISNSLDIHVHDYNDTGNFHVSYDYKVEKYNEVDISSIHERIINIINLLFEDSNKKIKDIDIVTPVEKEQILNKFIGPKVDYPRDSTIVSLFEENVLKYGDNNAIYYKDDSITYKDLNTKVNQFANYLLNSGISKNNIISVFMDKTIDYIIAILAVQKIGCAYLPINTSYPMDRIKYILENSKSCLLIADRDVDISNYLNINDIDYSNFSNQNPNIDISCEDLAYVIYTSGSTGNPKGVMIRHRNLINFVYSLNRQFKDGITPFDNCLSLANISFDASVFEIFSPIVLGSSLTLYEENILTDISLLIDTIYKRNISFLYIPPNILLDVYEQLKANNKSIPIKKLFVGVESIKNGTLNKYLSLNPDMEIVNAYGPTETSIVATFYPYKKNPNEDDMLPIGFPVNNSSIYIVNNTNSLQPIYTPGEIYVCGDNVSCGYINNKELTDKAFIPNFMGTGNIAYKTGDIGYWNKDGSIQFIGRNDSQIKFRGHRIELGEINNTIKAFKGILNSFTTIADVNGASYLCSYIVSDFDIIPELKKYLRNTLPYYMVPTHIIRLDNMPVNLNGKIDKTKLPKIESILSSEVVLPKNETEQILQDLWKNILGLTNISTNSDFFELGADSLCSIRLISDIYEKFNIKLPIKIIFDYSTIEKLAQYIDTEITHDESCKIKPLPASEYYPTSSAQKRIYYASQISGDKSYTYHICGGVILDGMLDVTALQNCLNILVRRHHSLRTYFDIVDNVIVQKIDENLNINLEHISCNESELDLAFKNFVTPFNLNTAPLAKFMLVSLDNQKSALLICMHHIIADGTSVSLLIDELCKLYNSEQLPEHTVHYRDFANWENEQLTSGSYKEHEQFWKEQFSDEIPVLNLPTQFARPSVQSFEGNKVHSYIDESLTSQINNLAKKLNVTPYMLLLSAYYILLAKYSYQDDIVVGSPIVGRQMPETYNMVGMFVNSLPLRAKVTQDISFNDFAESIKELCISCFEHQVYPFDELISNLKIKRDISRNPLFDTMFIYQNNGNPKVNFGDLNTTYYVPDSNISKFDLSLEIIPEEEQLELNFEYCTKLFEHSFIENMSRHYINILKNIVNNSNVFIKDICMLSDNEKDMILRGFNHTNTSYPSKTIAQIFEEQVNKTPDKTAVVFGEKSLTYKELNEKANCLANYIKSKNVVPGNIIGILLNRSLELIISQIAILKLGAAYLPLDPTYPKNRIEYILKDSNVEIILTDNTLKTILDDNVVCIDTSLANSSIYDAGNTSNPNISFSTQNNAYLIYTSGSTGNPKGVTISNKNVVNFSVGITEQIPIHKLQNIVCITTVCFDIYVLETLLPLQYGMTVVMANENEQVNPKYLNELCLKNNVEIIQTTPSKFSLLLSDKENLEYVKNLKYILLGGEAFPEKLLAELKELTNAQVWNMYGPTETTVWSSVKNLTNETKITIGKPIANTQMYILDKGKKLVPVGFSGDLYIGGDGLSKGYYNKDNLTQERFIQNPYIPSDIIYNTGDLAKWKTDGEIEYLCRSDFQVKLRGLRIELGEIENRISDFPDVLQVVVSVGHDEHDREFLCAYFTANSKLSIPNLKKYLTGFLPAYMIPTYFMQLDSFKYTPNGKIDRKLLPIPAFSSAEKEIILPENEIEEKISKVFENLLNISPISINDSFFDIGGDSILALRLQLELMNQNMNITYSDIFKFNTIKELALKISTGGSDTVDAIPDYDYTNINSIISKNTEVSLEDVSKHNLGDIALTGVTGFLGAHILDYILSNTDSNVYCMVRKNSSSSIEEKVLSKLHYYFGDKYDEQLNKRFFIVLSDITKENLDLSKSDYKILQDKVSCVINSAALVKHFGYYSEFEKINVLGVKNIIEFCKKANKKLIQISTTSVSGNTLVGKNIEKNSFNEDICYTEDKLYVNQSFENVYVKSKFEAEKLVLEQVASGQLDALILRVGNITSRFADGKFQQNAQENAFLNRLKAFLGIGLVPDNLSYVYLEFSPVDFVAKAVVNSIMYANPNINILHIYNSNHVYLNDFVKFMDNAVTIVDKDTFRNTLQQQMQIPEKKEMLSFILNDLKEDYELDYNTSIKLKNDFSNMFLKKTGFDWPTITKQYIMNMFKD